MIWISVDAKPIKQALITLISKWTFAFANYLLQNLVERTEEMQRFVSHANGKLKSFVDSKDSLPVPEIMGIITDVRRTSTHTEDMFEPWQVRLAFCVVCDMWCVFDV